MSLYRDLNAPDGSIRLPAHTLVAVLRAAEARFTIALAAAALHSR
jgi:hypothetical protein